MEARARTTEILFFWLWILIFTLLLAAPAPDNRGGWCGTDTVCELVFGGDPAK